VHLPRKEDFLLIQAVVELGKDGSFLFLQRMLSPKSRCVPQSTA
jgi:hypothetical protein